MRGHGVKDALAATASGGRVLRSPDGSGTNHCLAFHCYGVARGSCTLGALFAQEYLVIGTPYHGGLTVRLPWGLSQPHSMSPCLPDLLQRRHRTSACHGSCRSSHSTSPWREPRKVLGHRPSRHDCEGTPHT